MIDRFDRVGDIVGRIVGDRIFHPRREALGGLGDLLLHRFRRGQRVRARQLRDAERGHRLAAQSRIDRVILRAELDPRDVAQPRQPPLVVALDHDLAELLGRGQAALRLDPELERRAALVERRRPDRPDRDLRILRADLRDDLVDREVARGGEIGIDPHAHVIVAPTERADPADAGDARDAVDDLRRRIVRDILVRQRSVGRGQRDHQQDVGRILEHRHADLADLVGQPRLGGRDAVLHEHLRLIDIDPLLEGHGDRDLAVAGVRRGHVDHVLDAVDRFLERRGDGLGERLGGRAGIARGDDDGRRRDLGILRDRQRRIGDDPEDHDQHRHDRREDRALDEEMGEFHRGVTSRSRRMRAARCRAASSARCSPRAAASSPAWRRPASPAGDW